MSVILSVAKNLYYIEPEILRYAQNDNTKLLTKKCVAVGNALFTIFFYPAEGNRFPCKYSCMRDE